MLSSSAVSELNQLFADELKVSREFWKNSKIARWEMVDLGAASGLEGVSGESQMYCEGKGFYRPQFLHINPNGGVRTCMYASGASWLGNINNESLSEISDSFSRNPVVDFFSSNGATKRNLVEKIYSGKDTPKHPCSLAVKIADIVEVNRKNIKNTNEVE